MAEHKSPAYLDDFLTFDDPEPSALRARLEALDGVSITAMLAGRTTHRVEGDVDERPWNRLPILAQATIVAIDRWAETNPALRLLQRYNPDAYNRFNPDLEI